MSTKENREEGTVLLEQKGPIAVLTLSRPAALNALTWAMYQELETHLEFLANETTIRVVILRGDGNAFAAGTNIQQFRGFTGADGVAYEHKMEAIIERLYTLPKPVIVAVRGYAVGAGLVLSVASDLRYAAPSARFGAPIARTLGNCLSLKNYQHLAQAFGTMRAKEMLFTARLLSATDALQCGFLTAIVEEENLFPHVLEVAQQISSLAPLTIWATKEAHRCLNAVDTVPYDDVLTRVYASHDFAEGVQAYLEKRKPVWSGN
jgi:enoyl-CoA hydratase/carnithine racemase